MDNFSEEELEDFVEITKVQSSIIRQSGKSLIIVSDCLDEMIKIYTDPLSIFIPDADYRCKIEELQNKMNAAIAIASSNMNIIQELLDEQNKNGEENGKNN